MIKGLVTPYRTITDFLTCYDKFFNASAVKFKQMTSND